MVLFSIHHCRVDFILFVSRPAICSHTNPLLADGVLFPRARSRNSAQPSINLIYDPGTDDDMLILFNYTPDYLLDELPGKECCLFRCAWRLAHARASSLSLCSVHSLNVRHIRRANREMKKDPASQRLARTIGRAGRMHASVFRPR